MNECYYVFAWWWLSLIGARKNITNLWRHKYANSAKLFGSFICVCGCMSPSICCLRHASIAFVLNCWVAPIYGDVRSSYNILCSNHSTHHVSSVNIVSQSYRTNKRVVYVSLLAKRYTAGLLWVAQRRYKQTTTGHEFETNYVYTESESNNNSNNARRIRTNSLRTFNFKLLIYYYLFNKKCYYYLVLWQRLLS